MKGTLKWDRTLANTSRTSEKQHSLHAAGSASWLRLHPLRLSDSCTWQDMDVLVSIHVVGQVTCELLEKLDLGSQLQLHLKHETGW